MKNALKTTGFVILILLGSFLIGVLSLNYIAMPLWIGLHEEIEVPDICGKPIEEVKKILAELGLKSEVRAQKFSELPERIVISQMPLPTRRVRRNRIITLCTSRGKERTKVPWVEDLLLTQAENLLENAGIKAREVIYEYSAEVPVDRVIRTNPPADIVVNKGTRIDIFVSQGGLNFTIPDFTWQTLRKARARAEELGLILDIEYIAEPSPEGIVIAQSPLSGAPAQAGDYLKLVIGLPR